MIQQKKSPVMFCFPQPIGTKMALKFLKKKTTKLKSFLREYSISLYLSPCSFIINMFGIAFETEEYYVFAQEYAPSGDLFDIIPPQVMQRQLTSIMHMNKTKSYFSQPHVVNFPWNTKVVTNQDSKYTKKP